MLRHPDIDSPSDDTVIWRYLSLDRFLWLITKRSLILSRVDQFKDPWEGVWTKSLVAAIEEKWPGHPAAFIDWLSKQRQFAYASCWHESDCESAALWDLYADDTGVAIRSTIGRLRAAISTSHEATYIGRVAYANYQSVFDRPRNKGLTPLEPMFLKRSSFAHEREVRLVVWKLSEAFDQSGSTHSDEAFLELSVDLNGLIDATFLSPNSPSWLLTVVRDLVRPFGLTTVPIERSPLYESAVA